MFDDHLIDITYKVEKYPNFPFKSPISVVVDLRLLGYNVNTTLSSKQITDLGYKLLTDEFTKILKNLGKSTAEATKIQIVAFGGPRIYFSYLDITSRKLNAREIEREFDFQFQSPTISWDFDGLPKVSLDVPNLIDNRTIKVDFYGGARRDKTWVGKRLLFEK